MPLKVLKSVDSEPYCRKVNRSPAWTVKPETATVSVPLRLTVPDTPTTGFPPGSPAPARPDSVTDRPVTFRLWPPDTRSTPVASSVVPSAAKTLPAVAVTVASWPEGSTNRSLPVLPVKPKPLAGATPEKTSASSPVPPVKTIRGNVVAPVTFTMALVAPESVSVVTNASAGVVTAVPSLVTVSTLPVAPTVTRWVPAPRLTVNGWKCTVVGVVSTCAMTSALTVPLVRVNVTEHWPLVSVVQVAALRDPAEVVHATGAPVVGVGDEPSVTVAVSETCEPSLVSLTALTATLRLVSPVV